METTLAQATKCSRKACGKPLRGKRYKIFNEPATGIPRDYCITCGRGIVAANPGIQYTLGNGEEVTLSLPVFLHRKGEDTFLGGHLGVGGKRHDMYFSPGGHVLGGNLVCRHGDDEGEYVSYGLQFAEKSEDDLPKEAFRRAIEKGLVRKVMVPDMTYDPTILKKPPVTKIAAVVCLHHEGRVLVGFHKRRKGWEFPGGLKEEGETIAQAAVRECREEVGVQPDIDGLKLLGYVEWPTNKANENWLTMLFGYRCSAAARAAACAQEKDNALSGVTWTTTVGLEAIGDKTYGLQGVCDQLMDQIRTEVNGT